MASKVVPSNQLNAMAISMESHPPIPRQNKLSEEGMEKKAMQTIYARLKEAACCQNKSRVVKRWQHIENILKSFQYKGDKKKIIEKLDDDNNYAPIHHAVLSNNQFVCRELLGDKYKCNVNLFGWDGQTPLHLAASSSLIEEEISQATDISKENPEVIYVFSETRTKMSVKVYKGSILLMLLKHKNIHVNIQDDKGRTPLHHAIMRNHSAIMKILIEFKADPRIPDIQGATSIHYAYRFGTKEIYIEFPLCSEYFHLKTIDNKTPFEFAAEYGHLDIIKEYFRTPSSTEDPNYNIYTLIHGAIRQRDSKLLHEYFSIEDENVKRYILQLACCYPNGYKLLEELTKQNISNIFIDNILLGQNRKDGFTPLMIAVKYRQETCVKLLLDTIVPREKIGILFNKSSHDFERTVLHICAQLPDDSLINDPSDEMKSITDSPSKVVKSIIDSLLEKAKSCKIDLAPVDVMRFTPLHICAKQHNLYMCDKLLPISHKCSETELNSKSISNHKANNSILIPKLLTIRNNDGLTAFHIATENGHYKIIKRMIEAVSNPKILIEDCDQQLRTSLHIAALKGDAKIVQMFIHHKADVNKRDVNDHTPLHEAARWSDSSNREDNQHRIECINHLIKAGAEVNALNIYRESPLHIACRYSSSDLVKNLLDHDANLLQTNTHGYNCLEVAIEEKNEEIVKYLIDRDDIFELMRNAQICEKHYQPCCTYGNRNCRKFCCVPCCKCLEICSHYTCRMGLDHRTADTPMRKLIINMPDMAFEILEKCTTTIGSEKSHIHKQFFDYEFLEDQYVLQNWTKGNVNNNPTIHGNSLHNNRRKNDEEKETDKPYSYNFQTLVMCHPLFLMAVHNRYKLMAHPLSKSLVYRKFYGFDLIIFILLCFGYLSYLGLFTTIVLRTRHPQAYYNLTGFDYDPSLCRNVTEALGNKALKERIDQILVFAMYINVIVVLTKDLWYIIVYVRVGWSKIFTFILEMISIGCSSYFIYDYDYQHKFTMRCSLQWEIGAFGLFFGYTGLFYYIQYLPIFGIYVIMMRQILIRFILFLPVLMVLLCSFTLTLYMIFQNFDAFGHMGIGLAKTVIMTIGEINYDDFMYDDKKVAYYKVGHVLLVIFAVAMVILATNLLIGLAVGEIGPMMSKAKQTRLDMLYELTADLEIFKLQCLLYFNCCCNRLFIKPEHYKQNDLSKQWKWLRSLKKEILYSCAREVDDDDISCASEDEETEKPIDLLQDIRKKIQQINKPKSTNSTAKNQPLKSEHGSKYKSNTMKKKP